jgi:hypothetical protein
MSCSGLVVKFHDKQHTQPMVLTKHVADRHYERYERYKRLSVARKLLLGQSRL